MLTKWSVVLLCCHTVPETACESLCLPRVRRRKRHEEAGADFVGDDDFVEKIKGGWLDFDKCHRDATDDGNGR